MFPILRILSKEVLWKEFIFRHEISVLNIANVLTLDGGGDGIVWHRNSAPERESSF